MYRPIVTFLFPVVLIVAERIARGYANSESTKFLAPTLVAIALGLLFPLLAPENRMKYLSQAVRAGAVGVVIYNVAEEKLSHIANVLVYLFSFVWIWFLFLSIRSGAPENPAIWGYSTWIYAAAVYALCACLAEIKEHL